MNRSRTPNPSWGRKETLFSLVFLVIIVGVRIIVSFVLMKKQSKTPKEYQVTSIYKYYNEALKAAQNIREDAELNMFAVSVFPEDPENNMPITYGFDSRKEEPKGINVYIYENDQGYRVKTTEFTQTAILLGLPQPPLVLSEIKSDSGQAFEIIMKNGGEEIISTYDIKYPIHFYLSFVPQSDTFEWIATFYNQSESKAWHISIDAYTNELSEKKRLDN